MIEHMELKPGYPVVQILALTLPICVTLDKLLNLSVPQFAQLQDGDSLIDIHYSKDCGLPWWRSGKEPACQCRRLKRHGFNPWVRNIPGGGHGNPIQYSCLENPMDRGAWRATVHRVAESDGTKTMHT